MKRIMLYLMVAVLVISVLMNIGMYRRLSHQETRTDTVTVVEWKEIHDTIPQIVKEKIVKYITLNDSDTVTEEKVLPIVQRKYSDDSTYTAYVSGAQIAEYPRLDSINVRQKIVNHTITNTIYREKGGVRVKIRPSLGGGYGITTKKWDIWAGGSVFIDW